MTSDRRRYLANLIGRGILKEAANDVQVRFLVQLLEQVNDVEIIQLGYYNQPDIEAKNAYKKLHSHAVERVAVSSRFSRTEGKTPKVKLKRFWARSTHPRTRASRKRSYPGLC